MGLGIKKYFAMTDVLGMRRLKVGPGHIVEVVFTYKYSGALIVDIEEGLEVAKFVRFMWLMRRQVADETRSRG